MTELSAGQPISIAIAGGGTNVISLAAALYAISRRRPVRAVVGTSAGGLSALAFAFGVQEERLQAQLEGACSRNRILDGGPINLAMRGGWARGEELRRNAALLVGERTTMGDAPIPVACVVADLWTGMPKVVSSWEHPTALAVDVAVATAAIPYVFEPQRIRGLDEHTYVDGGVVKNVPSDVLDILGYPVVTIRPFFQATAPKEPKAGIDRLLAVARLGLHAASNGWHSRHPDSVTVDVTAEDGFDFDLSRAVCVRRRAAGLRAGSYCTLPGGVF